MGLVQKGQEQLFGIEIEIGFGFELALALALELELELEQVCRKRPSRGRFLK